MNYRTLTDNPQATELISAVKDLKPVTQQNYKGCVEYLAADNASYAALIAQHKTMQEPPKDWRTPEIPGEFVAFSAFVTGLIFVFALVYGLYKNHKKQEIDDVANRRRSDNSEKHRKAINSNGNRRRTHQRTLERNQRHSSAFAASDQQEHETAAGRLPDNPGREKISDGSQGRSFGGLQLD